MESLLVENPEKYLYSHNININQKELEISTEIFLSEKALYPAFQINYHEDEELKELYWFFKNQYKKKFPHHFKSDALLSIFYFSFIEYSMNHSPLLRDTEEWKEYIAYRTIEELQSNHTLKSQVAYRLLKLNHYYQKTIMHNRDILKEKLKDENTIKTIIDIMILQHNEIYSLESERLEQTEEYNIYEKYISDLTIADFLTE